MNVTTAVSVDGNEEDKAKASALPTPDTENPGAALTSADPAESAMIDEDAITDFESDEDLEFFIDGLLADNNELLTRPDGPLDVKEDTRNLIALFGNGRFLVCESHRYDGRVLSFEVLARRKRLAVGKPEYVSMGTVKAVYQAAEREQTSKDGAAVSQLQMQRDFIALVQRAAAMKVSDIHVVVSDHTTIYFRVNGMMMREMEYDNAWGESFVRAAFASADISDSNYAQNEYQGAQKSGQTPLRGSEGRLMLPRNVLAIRLQFNPVAFGSQYLVMRLLYADTTGDKSADLKSLGYTQYEEDLFFRMRAAPIGLCIVAGPTGSGKSTTLQRNMIKMLQERRYEINLLTVEDPPEYPIPGARQMPVTNASTEQEKEMAFTKALSAALRSDPDVIMVGEIRTLTAAQLAYKGALSGHAMWTTLHANSAPAIVVRLKDMGVEDFKLRDPELMRGLISQRLFRKLCPVCRSPLTNHPKHPTMKRVQRALGDIGVAMSFLRGPGCTHCDNKGVTGRLVVGELISPDSTFLELILAGQMPKAVDYWVSDLGGRTMKEAAIERMLQGMLDVEEVERWCGLLDERPSY